MGGGNSLDDLAETLCELGYLSNSDIYELEEKLSAMAGGTKVYSLAASDEVFEDMWLEHSLDRCSGNAEICPDDDIPF